MEVFIQDSVASQSPPGVAPSGEGRARKERADCKVTDEGLYHAIVAHLGVLSYVALAVGINRSALYKRIERAPALQAARDGARRMLLSRATYHLRKALHAGIDWAVHYVMCREDQLWTPFNEPQPPTEAQANRAPREPKLEAEEVEEQPERAGKSLRRLIRAVERGEPWAVKYCLNHLDPRGRYAKKSRGRKAEATVGTTPPEAPPVVIDEVAAELAKAVFDAERGRGTDQRQKQAAPAVCDQRAAAEELTTSIETLNETASPAPARVLMSEAACQEEAMTSSAHAQQPLVSAPTLETESAPTVSVNGQNLSHEFAPTVDVGFTRNSTSQLPAAPHLTGTAPEPFAPTLEPAPTLDAAPPPTGAPTKPAKCSPSPKRKQQKAQSRDRTRKRRVRPLSTKKRSRVPRSHSLIGQ